MSLSLRIIKNTNFASLYRRFLLDKDISQSDIKKMLSLAVIFLNSNDENVTKLGYRIIVIYSNRYKDYGPLYEVSINKGLYPIAKFIDEHFVENENKTFFTELNSSFLETYKANNVYFSEQQFLLNEFYKDNLPNSISVIAPTSYGKTELILETVKEWKDRNICIITPTKSLLAQTRFRILKAKILSSKNIIVHPDMYNSGKNCIAVMTQERILRLLKENPNLFFDCVIVDEAHGLLANEQRERTLASAIIILNKRNKNAAFKFLTPFLCDEKNLKVKYTSYDLSAYKINESVKTERIYLYDIRFKNGLQFYDQYIDEWIDLTNESNELSSIEFIQKYSDAKNIVYFNKPTDIEKYARELVKTLPSIELPDELKTAISHISQFIDSEYTLVECLKKGVIYHHGAVPDTVRSYIEFLYLRFPQIKYVLTSSTLLEGVNMPATKIFIMDNRKGGMNLPPSSLKNLIGRVCRFNEIFNKETGSLQYLEPCVYFVFDQFYKKGANIKNYISTTMRVDKKISDNIENVLLDNNKNYNETDFQQAIEFVENYEEGSIADFNERKTKTGIGKSCILNNISEIDIFSEEINLQEKVNQYKVAGKTIENVDELINSLCDLFFGIKNINDNLERFQDEATRRYYSMFLNWRISAYPYNAMVGKITGYWNGLINNNKDTLIYVGRWGDQTRNGGHRALWTDIKQKSDNQLINLSIVKIKEEQDFVENTLMKFVEVLNDLGLISENFYLILKYGTDKEDEIVLIRNGVSLALTKILFSKYKKYLKFDRRENIIYWEKDLIDEMKINHENQILIYEAELNII